MVAVIVEDLHAVPFAGACVKRRLTPPNEASALRTCSIDRPSSIATAIAAVAFSVVMAGASASRDLEIGGGVRLAVAHQHIEPRHAALEIDVQQPHVGLRVLP